MTITSLFRRPAARIALAVAVVLALPAVAMLFTDEVRWGVGDFALAGGLLAIIGGTVELAVKNAGNVLTAAVVGALGVAAVLFGQADDAPGLVLLGILLVGGACALGVRRARARSQAPGTPTS